MDRLRAIGYWLPSTLARVRAVHGAADPYATFLAERVPPLLDSTFDDPPQGGDDSTFWHAWSAHVYGASGTT